MSIVSTLNRGSWFVARKPERIVLRTTIHDSAEKFPDWLSVLDKADAAALTVGEADRGRVDAEMMEDRRSHVLRGDRPIDGYSPRALLLPIT